MASPPIHSTSLRDIPVPIIFDVTLRDTLENLRTTFAAQYKAAYDAAVAKHMSIHEIRDRGRSPAARIMREAEKRVIAAVMAAPAFRYDPETPFINVLVYYNVQLNSVALLNPEQWLLNGERIALLVEFLEWREYIYEGQTNRYPVSIQVFLIKDIYYVTAPNGPLAGGAIVKVPKGSWGGIMDQYA